MTISEKLESHLRPNRKLTEQEWTNLRGLTKELRLVRGDRVDGRRFVVYHRGCVDGLHLVSEEHFIKIQEASKESHRRNKHCVDAWHERNREPHRLRVRERYAGLTKEQRAARNAVARQWEKSNPDKVREISRRKHQRLQSDPARRAALTLRARLKAAVSERLLYGRSADRFSAEFLIWLAGHTGQDIAEINKFHIDHIIPLSKCDLSTIEGQRGANSPFNVRWLTREENIAKSDKMPSGQEITAHHTLVRQWMNTVGESIAFMNFPLPILSSDKTAA